MCIKKLCLIIACKLPKDGRMRYEKAVNVTPSIKESCKESVISKVVAFSGQQFIQGLFGNSCIRTIFKNVLK